MQSKECGGPVADTNTESVEALAAEIDAARSKGYDDWRVQNPVDRSVCMSFAWAEVINPERAAREWLADHKRRFPDSRFAGYEVACVRVVPNKDRLMAAAVAALRTLAAERDALRAELDAERSAWGKAMSQAWRMVDPFNPAGVPGSYARGQDSGITSALTTVRANYLAAIRSTPKDPT